MSASPRWDLTPIFTSARSPELRREIDRIVAGVASLAALIGAPAIDDNEPGSPDDMAVAAFERIVRDYEALLELAWTVESYVLAMLDVDAGDEAAAVVDSRLRKPLGALRHLGKRLAKSLPANLDALLDRSPVAGERELALRRLAEGAARAMPDAAEELATELHTVSGGAWGRLRSRVVADARADLDTDGRLERVALSTLRRLASDRDRTTRRRAFDAESAAYAAHATPLAAALNGVAGEAGILARRRGWPDPLDEALVVQGLDRTMLDPLLAATEAALPTFRRHLDVKARALGVDRLAWFDLTAPVGEPRLWTFGEAAELAVAAFTPFSPALGTLAERAVAERWVDAEPRPGKQGGGMCYWTSRGPIPIRVEFLGGYDGVRMLAHEIGHAYHSAVLRREARPALQIEAAPAPLLETASKLCEELVRREAMERARRAGDASGELDLLDGFLTGARRSVVDALVNFRFEERLLTRRSDRELSVDEINALMTDVRGEVDGDALEPTFPWTWAAQPHLYLDNQRFYNLPYLFGQVLALGLAARHAADPLGFSARFDAFLADVGRFSTVDLGRSMGVDLTSTAFWADGLSVLVASIDRYEALVDGLP